MSLINYLPPFLREIREYKEIMNVGDIEIDKIKNQVENLKEEMNIANASEYVIKRYEKILGIKNNADLNLDERKLIIRNLFLNRAPYTVLWLKNKLESICGKDNYDISIDYNNYFINIQIGYLFKEATEELRKDLINIIPANLNLLVDFWYVEKLTVKQVIKIQEAEFLQIKQVN